MCMELIYIFERHLVQIGEHFLFAIAFRKERCGMIALQW